MATALTKDQYEIWIADQADPKGSHAMVLTCFRARGTLDPRAFLDALRRLGKRHPALCLMIDDSDGTARAISAPPENIPVKVDVCPSRETHPEDWVSRRLQAIATFRIDLRRAPAIAVRILVLSATDYVICFCGHHISLDDLSLTVMLRDFGRFYTAARTEPCIADDAAVPPQTETPLRLPDARRADQLRYVPLPWPGRTLKAPGNPTRTGINIPYRVALDPDRVSALRQIARSKGTTLFCLCAAAYKVLLARYCGVDKVAVGVAYSLRGNRAAFEEVGAWVSYTGVETAIDPAIGIGEMGAAFGKELAAIRNGDAICSLTGYSATIVRYLAPRTMPDMLGMDVAEFDAPVDSVLVELATSLREVDGQLVILMRGRERLFTSADLKALMDGFVAILDGLIADQHLTAGIRIPLRRETTAIHSGRAVAATPQATEVDLASVFRHCARQNAGEPALADPSSEIDYATLEQRANGLAHWMVVELGLQPRDRVALYLPRGTILPLMHLSALLAGLVVVPLDTAYPDDRIAQILQRATCRYVICARRGDHDRLQRIIDTAGLSCRLASVEAQNHHAPKDTPTITSHPEDPAYVIFTSGSTGIPKGVIVPRKALVRLALGCFARPVRPGHRVAQLASPGFDALFIELWSAFLNGGTLICPDRTPTAVDDFSRLLRDEQITHAFLTTSIFNLVVEDDIEALCGLEELAVGGEAMSAPHAIRAVNRFPDLVLCNAYGPTENGALSTTYRVSAETASDFSAIPIGTPLPGNVVLVLDADGKPVPDGFMGELWLGGPGLALGYDGDEELTAARFQLFDPAALGLGDGPALRLYRTGDKVRWDASGTVIEYHGRIDAQIKFNGYRIEPGEIESCMLSHPEIRRAAVVAARNGAGGTVSAIWAVYDSVVPPDSPGAIETSLRDLLAQELPRFMLPHRYLYLAEGLPLNSSGKIDRKAIEAIVEKHSQGGQKTLEGFDKRLVSIWSDVLQADDPRDDTDFFAQGGHSVLAMRLLSRLRRELGMSVSVADFLRAPTLNMLEQSLRRMRATADRKRKTGSENISLLVSGPEDVAPLFCLPGILGQPVWINAALPEMTDCGRMVLGLQMPEAPLPETMQDVARFHANEIVEWHKSRRLDARPILAGFSLGGLLTVAVAAELEAIGRPPAKVIVVDPGTNFFPNPLSTIDPNGESISVRLAELRKAHVLRPIGTHLDFILATRGFPWERLPPSDDWACIAQNGVSIYPADAHHLSITQRTNAPLLAGLLKHLIDGTLKPAQVIDDPWSPEDVAHLRQSASLTLAGHHALALEALDRLSERRRGYPAVLLQRLRLWEQMGDRTAVQSFARELLDGTIKTQPALLLSVVEALDRMKCADLADRLDATCLASLAHPSAGLLFQRAQRALNRKQHMVVAEVLANPHLASFDPMESALIRLMAERRASDQPPDGWQDALIAALDREGSAPSYFLATLRSLLVKGDDAIADALISLARKLFPGDPACNDLVALWKSRTMQWA